MKLGNGIFNFFNTTLKSSQKQLDKNSSKNESQNYGNNGNSSESSCNDKGSNYYYPVPGIHMISRGGKCGTPAPTPAHDHSPTPCPTPTPTPTPCPTPTPTPEPAPCPAPTPTPEPAPCPTPTPTPCPTPTPTPEKVWGSLNISGDPTLTVTTPGSTLGSMGFHPSTAEPFNVINDPDGNFNMDVNMHAINPEGNTGIKDVNFTAAGHDVQFANDGSLIVDNVNRGNLLDGSVQSIDLGNGVSVKAAQMADGAGTTASRLVLTTPEYEVTAALRQPDGAGSYYDVNVAEKTANAADNATSSTIPGQTVNVMDLLKQEPTA